MIVYISIGNSDDKLTQKQWSQYVDEVGGVIAPFPWHGCWASDPVAEWQNACWCVEFPDNDSDLIVKITRKLIAAAGKYKQDSIAWAEARTVFLTPGGTSD